MMIEDVRPEGCICELCSDISLNHKDIRTKLGYTMLYSIFGLLTGWPKKEKYIKYLIYGLNIMNQTIKYAAIAGILSIIVAIALVILEILKSLNPLSGGMLTAYILVYVLSLVLYVFFVWGFKIIGEKTNVSLLTIMSYILIISSIIYYGYFILTAISPTLDNTIISISILVFYGAVGIPFGIGLLKLKNQFGSIATASGVLMIITSVSFFTVILSIIGTLTLIPTYILEVILLFKASKKL